MFLCAEVPFRKFNVLICKFPKSCWIRGAKSLPQYGSTLALIRCSFNSEVLWKHFQKLLLVGFKILKRLSRYFMMSEFETQSLYLHDASIVSTSLPHFEAMESKFFIAIQHCSLPACHFFFTNHACWKNKNVSSFFITEIVFLVTSSV